jgi:hypothetical protein
MKLSEIARYWAARQLTTIVPEAKKISFKAPFASPGFTVKTNAGTRNPQIKTRGESRPLVRIKDLNQLKTDTWFADKTGTFICFNLEKGESEIIL